MVDFSMLADPNVQRLLATTGQGVSSGQNIGEALGGAANQFGSMLAGQKLADRQEKKSDKLMDVILKALGEDPTGKNILGDPEDMSTLNKITMDNKGIKLDMPNPGITRPFQSLQDVPVENQTFAPKTPERSFANPTGAQNPLSTLTLNAPTQQAGAVPEEGFFSKLLNPISQGASTLGKGAAGLFDFSNMGGGGLGFQ